MQIRPLLSAQMEQCLSLVRGVFDRFEAPDYSREGIASFYAFLDSVPGQFSSGAFKIWAALREDRLVFTGRGSPARWFKRRRLSPGKTDKSISP